MVQFSDNRTEIKIKSTKLIRFHPTQIALDSLSVQRVIKTRETVSLPFWSTCNLQRTLADQVA
jgi:hypothetical protein